MPTPVGIVGLGAIGGSLALALRDSATFRVSSWADRPADRDAAKRSGVAVADSLAALAHDPALVVLAIPLDRIVPTARRLLEHAPDLTLLHTGSLQGADALGIDEPLAAHVFGTHPIAGTHASGFEAARPDLFHDAVVSIERRTPAPFRDGAEALWRAAGAVRIERRDAEEHDARMAWVSHLPQLVSTALAAALARSTVPADEMGPGARDTTRLAQSSFEMWRPIIRGAPLETRLALRAVGHVLASIENALEAGDPAALERTWEDARRWRLTAERV
jgi:prephenate dehydrogenase